MNSFFESFKEEVNKSIKTMIRKGIKIDEDVIQQELKKLEGKELTVKLDSTHKHVTEIKYKGEGEKE